MRVLVCGSRDFEFYELVESWIRCNTPWNAIIIHGNAKGADLMADQVAREQCLQIEKYPADWTKYRRAAGPIRNQQMLDEGKPDHVVAFFTDVERSKGTRDMVMRALKAGVPVSAVEARTVLEEELRSRLGVPLPKSEETTTTPDM